MKEKTKHHKHNISAGFHPGIDKEEEEEEMKEKTKHHKHNISAGFHPGIDNISAGFHPGIDKYQTHSCFLLG